MTEPRPKPAPGLCAHCGHDNRGNVGVPCAKCWRWLAPPILREAPQPKGPANLTIAEGYQPALGEYIRDRRHLAQVRREKGVYMDILDC